MKSNYYILAFIALYCNASILATQPDDEPKAVLEQKLSTEASQELVRINYTDKPLPELVNEMAAQMGTNIIMPQTPNPNFYDSKLTYHLSEPLSLDQAWQLVVNAMQLLGFMVRQQGDMVAIVPYTDVISAAKQPLTLYYNMPPDQLPNTQQIIRYIYYFKNLSVGAPTGSSSTGSTGSTAEGIKNILKSMLSAPPEFEILAQSNGILITDKAANIKAAMTIVAELDEGGLRDAIEVIPLYYTSAVNVATLFKDNIYTANPQTPSRLTQQKTKTVPYFPQNTKVAALGRGNSIVIMGTTRSIAIVKSFIIKYIDRPLESGESMLHVYDLQYLKAQEFGKILIQLVNSESDQTKKQTRGKTISTGPQRYFEDVVIVAEITTTALKLTPHTPIDNVLKKIELKENVKTKEIQVGGNRLIIAARKPDWLRIKQLIDQIDKPQLQVAIDVLILDVRLDKRKSLGGQIRNKEGFHDSTAESVNWQSAQLDAPILKPAPVGGQLPPDALMANLLQLVSTGTTGARANIASASAPGSFIISFKDKDNLGVWSVLQMLNLYTNSTVLAQPFLVTQNHQPAYVMTEQRRYRVGPTEGGSGQIARVNFEDIHAGVSLDVLPHISETGVINMQVIIQIDQFISSSDDKVNRVIQTNANVGNGEVLVLGGLTKTTESDVITESPLLGQVPVLGWFFKKKTKNRQKDHLMVLISPTIVEPYRKGGMSAFTEDKMNIAREGLDDDLAPTVMRDPITRWFFKPNCECPDEEINHYLELDYYTEEKSITIAQQRKRIVNSQKMQEQEEQELTQEREAYLKRLLEHEENPLSVVKQGKDELILDA